MSKPELHEIDLSKRVGDDHPDLVAEETYLIRTASDDWELAVWNVDLKGGFYKEDFRRFEFFDYCAVLDDVREVYRFVVNS